MSDYSYLEIWSHKKLALKSTTCDTCGQPIPIDTIQKDFLYDVQRILGIRDPQIKEGRIVDYNPLQSLYFEDYDYEYKKESIKDNYFKVGDIFMGNYVGLEHISIISNTFYLLTKFRKLLAKYFPNQEYYFWCVNQADEPFIPWTQLLLLGE